MSHEPGANDVPGVYLCEADGSRRCVHAYLDADYDLTDIPERLGLGRPVEPGENAAAAVDLAHREVREVKVQADAQSFDHEPEFIEMCADLWRCAESLERPTYRFESVE